MTASSPSTCQGKLLPILLLCFGALSQLTGCGAEDGLRAHYYWGAEVNVVCPCGSNLCYWVRAEPGQLDSLKNYVQRNSKRPYQPVFLIYRGHLLDEAAVGFGASYDGHMQVDEVISMSTELPSDCPASEND